jgi:hypothetical protein
MDKDEQDNDILNVVDTCAIQGDRVPSVPEKYHNVLFHLGIDPDDRIFVHGEFCPGVPESVVKDVEEWINNSENKIALPTYFYTTILINGVDTMPHLHLVYFAENEEAVWEFVKD